MYPLTQSSIPIDAKIDTPIDNSVDTPIDANVKENNTSINITRLNNTSINNNSATDVTHEQLRNGGNFTTRRRKIRRCLLLNSNHA